MQKTLGGDRLGSGKKMKVELPGYERSTHDMSYVWRSTMSAGTLVPFMCEVALPGDTWDVTLNAKGLTHPTIGPLFGSFKLQLDVMIAPIRLYNSKLHNNALGVGRNMSQIKLPQVRTWAVPYDPATTEDLDNAQINPSCILNYLGIRGVGHSDETSLQERDFNGVAWLFYWEAYKNYYANKQEEIGAVIHAAAVAINETVTAVSGNAVAIVQAPATGNTIVQSGQNIVLAYTGAVPIPNQIIFKFIRHGIPNAPVLTATYEELVNQPINDTGAVLSSTYNGLYGTISILNWDYIQLSQITQTAPRVVTFPLSEIDDMREAILAADGTVPFIINMQSLSPYELINTINETDPPAVMHTQEGLAVKTYQSDIFNNWLKTENIEAISTSTAIDTTGGSFTIDQLVMSKKVYNMLNRINVSGGSYNDWLDAVYTETNYRQIESPVYLGGLIKELVFQEVVSNASTDESNPLGTLAGKGVLSDKHKGGKVIIHVDEPSYILGIVSLTPRIDYSQGNRWDVNLKTMDDLHKPALDQIGFQELITEQMAYWDTAFDGTEWVQKSAGKQPAWLNYMTNYNRTYGNFAIENNEMFMTLNRRYENEIVGGIPQIKDLTTYIDPTKYNFIFAETQLDAQNFWMQIACDITTRRKMSAKIMPMA